jgi:hypothetical protein
MNTKEIIAKAKVEFPDVKYVCLSCGDYFDREPFGGYCDNNLDCTADGMLVEV